MNAAIAVVTVYQNWRASSRLKEDFLGEKDVATPLLVGLGR